MNQTTPSTSATWIALFRAQKRARAAIDAALKAADLPPLEQYDVLWSLEQALPHGLRPFELEQAILLPQHGVSRLTSHMVKQGLLDRVPCPDDKRGFRLLPTKAGQQLRQEIWEVYQPVISGFFDTHLSQDERQTLTQLLSRCN